MAGFNRSPPIDDAAFTLPPWTGAVVVGSGDVLRPPPPGRGWTAACSPLIAPGSKSSAWPYVMENRVGLVEWTSLALLWATGAPAHVRAVVQGEKFYSVRLEMDRRSGACECTCPAYASYGPCKHIYATAVHADRMLAGKRPPPDAWRPPRPADPPLWERRFRMVEAMASSAPSPAALPTGFTFALDASGSAAAGGLVIKSVQPGRKPGVMKPAPFDFRSLPSLHGPWERVARLCLSSTRSNSSYAYYGFEQAEFVLGPGVDALALRALAECPDAFLQTKDGPKPIRLLPDVLQLELRISGDDHHLSVSCDFAGLPDRGTPLLLMKTGIVVWPDGQCALFAPVRSQALVGNLARDGVLEIPRKELARLVRLVDRDDRIQIKAAPSTGLSVVERLAPLEAEFDLVDGTIVIAPRGSDPDTEAPTWSLNRERQELIRARFSPVDPIVRSVTACGATVLSQSREDAVLRASPEDLGKVVADLERQGVEMRLLDQRIRVADSTKLAVTSGIDWFEVTGEVRFGDFTVGLDALLSGSSGNVPMVRLPDGSLGIPGSNWDVFKALSALSERSGGQVRFSRPQAALLDHLLREQDVRGDETFEKVRGSLRTFDGIRAVEPPKAFHGELRPYQKEGLAWMAFLAEFGFGGCLADDMGLGKTVQVLALLAARGRKGKKASKPTLLVVPKSVIFNWKAESARFAPGLSILEYTGPTRPRTELRSRSEDIWLTTYATMRQDIGLLKEIPFSYVILDESQAIKNAASDTAKAVRLLNADHRLALSGTPVENHIGELKSLFDFLNPGLFGSAREMPTILREDGSDTVARMVRPFLLRRTKAKVAPDLPARIEQIIKIRLSPHERTVYDGVLRAARSKVLGAVESRGLARSKIHVLTALLRLRQAACHSALVGGTPGDPGSKVKELIERLLQLKDEGNKALVFSQFTEFLALVRRELPPELPHLYLDGKTRDRESLVKAFQRPEGPPVFLISLKAGGVGLNLTAAGYVFLLDPWWNPAVEAQAIDRAHRIGQTNSVIAYRLVAEDTIEEKILQLQEKKKDLFRSIVSEDGAGDESLLRSLTREDLEAILS